MTWWSLMWPPTRRVPSIQASSRYPHTARKITSVHWFLSAPLLVRMQLQVTSQWWMCLVRNFNSVISFFMWQIKVFKKQRLNFNWKTHRYVQRERKRKSGKERWSIDRIIHACTYLNELVMLDWFPQSVRNQNNRSAPTRALLSHFSGSLHQGFPLTRIIVLVHWRSIQFDQCYDGAAIQRTSEKEYINVSVHLFVSSVSISLFSFFSLHLSLSFVLSPSLVSFHNFSYQTTCTLQTAYTSTPLRSLCLYYSIMMINGRLQSTAISGYYEYLSQIRHRVNVTPHETHNDEESTTKTNATAAMEEDHSAAASNSPSRENLEKSNTSSESKDVTKWSSVDVQQWVEAQSQKYELKKATSEKFQMNGKRAKRIPWSRHSN